MRTFSPVMRGVPSSTRDDSRSLEHRVLKRRSASARASLGRHSRRGRQVRDAIDTRQGRAHRGPFLRRLIALGLVALAVADLFYDSVPLSLACLVTAVVLAAAAALLAIGAADSQSMYPAQARRWQLQAVASAAVMFMLMAFGSADTQGDLVRFVVVVGAASALVVMATSYRDPSGSGTGAISLALDSAVVGFTAALLTVILAPPSVPSGGAAILLGAFAGAGYSVSVATRPAVRKDPRGSDAQFLVGVMLLCLNAAGAAARQLEIGTVAALAAPGVALLGTVGLALSSWTGPRRPLPDVDQQASGETRLSLVPAAMAAAVILILSWLELEGHGTRAGFFGIITLFGLIVSRLLMTLIENRQLLQRVEQSGLFEEKLRDLGGALVAALDRKNTLELVCRTAQLALAADSVLLWMRDPSTDELEAVEVLSARREWLLGRRLSLDDLSSLAARVAHHGVAEIVSNVPTANASNGLFNTWLRAQCLLAVPVVHRARVQGVLVCVDARSPAAYNGRELAKAELLASQVAVALDNAYQHALQQRRLEELSALYQFAQSAHTAFSSVEIVRQLVPILKERLDYASCTIWLRDETTGTLRVAASDGAVGASRVFRPSKLAMRAFVSGEPAAQGLHWEEAAPDAPEVEADVDHSQLAVPMVLKRRVVGVVDLVSRAQAWSPTDGRLLVALANHAALAVDNLHLLDESRKVAALRELDRMKTELLGTVSHELRTPLGSIKGYATTLLTHGSKLRKDEQREFLEIIDSEADRLRELIENLLDLSRLEAGVLRIDRDAVRLAATAREVARKVQLAAQNHQLELDWPVDDPVVNADQKRIYQVVQNLLTNAVKYSPNGGCITLSATTQGRELVISVTDQGLGLPQCELDKIFDRFHRVQTDVSRGIGGTGLGLAICKGLVEAHGGHIWAESGGPGKGSAFRFTLPLLMDATEVRPKVRTSSNWPRLRPPANAADAERAVLDVTVNVASLSSRSKGAHDHQEANRTGRR